jgi:hypothetical protein
MAGEYGPASTDLCHQVTIGGSIATKWGLRFSPLFIADSGAPFNITVGHDLYGNTLFNGRPGMATHPNRPGLVATSYGLLDPNAVAGEVLLPRNYGRGPGIVMLNVRISKVFAFGPAGEGSISTGGSRRGQQGGPFSVGGSATTSTSTGHRYNLTVSLSTRNILNHNNPGPIIGIASPLFALANQPYGTGTLGGTGFSEAADNRRLELQVRFSFEPCSIYPWPRNGQLIGCVRLWIKDRYIQVSYAERDSQTNWRSVAETVLLDDGKRQWFRCPTCNRRAGTLFIVGPPFGCRVCMALAYQSQRQSPEERIRTRALRPGHLWNGSEDAFDYGLSDEDLDDDFDEEELEDDDLHEE